MEQNEPKGEQYPRGRGYGNDYMRGGEVFGGYGYQQRDEYVRPRGTPGQGDGDWPIDGIDGGQDDEFPQDDRAGHWEVPHDLGADPPPLAEGTDGADAPVPQIEHTFGDTGGNRMHSKSYYVTQAQLQQRLFKGARDGEPS
jgi:hypothetical protein